MVTEKTETRLDKQHHFLANILMQLPFLDMYFAANKFDKTELAFLRDMVKGTMSPEELSEKHQIATQSVEKLYTASVKRMVGLRRYFETQFKDSIAAAERNEELVALIDRQRKENLQLIEAVQRQKTSPHARTTEDVLSRPVSSERIWVRTLRVLDANCIHTLGTLRDCSKEKLYRMGILTKGMEQIETIFEKYRWEWK